MSVIGANSSMGVLSPLHVMQQVGVTAAELDHDAVRPLIAPPAPPSGSPWCCMDGQTCSVIGESRG